MANLLSEKTIGLFIVIKCNRSQSTIVKSFVNVDAKHDRPTAVVQHELVAVTRPGGNHDAATMNVGEGERESREVSCLPVGRLEDWRAGQPRVGVWTNIMNFSVSCE